MAEKLERLREYNGDGDATYLELSKRLRDAGLFRRRTSWYIIAMLIASGLFAIQLVALATLRNSWWAIAISAGLAISSAQVAFLAHDAGHGQILATRLGNDRLGLVFANLLCGFSYEWWVLKHTRHHAHPNRVDFDPDISHNVIVYTPEQAIAPKGLSRWTRRHQAFLFFVLITLQAVSMHGNSILAVCRGTRRFLWTERILLIAHLILYTLAMVLAFRLQFALIVIAVHQGMLGMYLGLVFAPNHKGMAIDSREQARDFLRRQCETSRNVKGGRILDLAFGGLNYQIEHHLFPALPRPALREAALLTHQYFDANNLCYSSCRLLEAYAVLARYLHRVGRGMEVAKD